MPKRREEPARSGRFARAEYTAAVKLYTRGGDAGETSLFGGRRVGKDDDRIEAYGSVDETNSVIGVAVASIADGDLRECLEGVQVILFDIGAELASPRDPTEDVRARTPKVTRTDIESIESWIDRLDALAPPLRTFVLPGGAPAAAQLHVARTVCRRAERRVVELGRTEPVPPRVLEYLNRLSDLLFAMARAVNARAGVAEPAWVGRERARDDDAG